MKQILAYNFNTARLNGLRMLSMLVKAKLVPVSAEQHTWPIGAVAGMLEEGNVPELPQDDEIVLDVEISGYEKREMLVLCDFSRIDLDKLLQGIKRGPLKAVELKAMLTPYNAKWSGVTLLRELAQEHAYMKAQAKGAKQLHQQQ